MSKKPLPPNAPRLFSLNQKPGKTPQVLKLKDTDTFIGRQEGCKVRIPSNAVSRRHCKLSFLNDLLTAEDLGSSNGTYINETRIKEPSYVKPGDVLRVGPFRFLVHYQLSEKAIRHLLEYLASNTDAASIDVEQVDIDAFLLEESDVPVALDSAAEVEKPAFGARK